MRTFFHGVAVDMARAESSRFRHPLLFIHGFWSGSWVWQGFMGYLAHRGWDSWAPSFLEGSVPSSADRVERLIDFCRTLPSPPVIVGHDAGTHLATRLAVAIEAPAVVAISPLLSRRDASKARIFAWPQFWKARLFGSRLAPPSNPGRTAYLDPQLDRPDSLRPDSASFFRELAAASLACPGRSLLMVGSTGDTIVGATELEQLAARRGWSFQRHAADGHFPMVEPGWQQLADDVHRWLVRTLGERLLVFLDDEQDLE
jgi:pimeloyl-ACP methyl ester carboxylesterase